MTATEATRDRLIELRRDLHRHPEPAWREFYTTARVVEGVERVGVDALHLGADALAVDDRMGVPPDDEIDEWYERARREGANEEVLARLDDRVTGAVAVLEAGDGPTVGLRVDVDALPIEEADETDHLPAAEGFRSEHEGYMHACGHDGHATIGVGVLERVAESDFDGTFKLFVQPAEEVLGGGKALANGPHVEDVDYLLGLHLGLDHPTGEVVAGIDRALAMARFRAAFEGESAHAGIAPNEGRNAVHAAGTAIENCYGIPRHEDGATRVNVGVVEGGTATNVVAERARVEGEVRGETTELMEYMDDRVRQTLRSAGEMHDCEVAVERTGEAIRQDSDQSAVDVVSAAARAADGVSSVVERDGLGASEDVTYLMRAVAERGGAATFVGVGTDHRTGHHTETFDVDERSLEIGVEVLSDAVERFGERDR